MGNCEASSTCSYLNEQIIMKIFRAKRILLATVILFFSYSSFSQGYDFVYYGAYSTDKELDRVGDSLNGPLLVFEGKVYSIGSNCVSRLIDGSINDRKKKGGKNDRNSDGDENVRNSGGDEDNRDAGGNIGYRKKKGGKNGRDKDGNENDRNSGGDNDDRDADGDADSRDADGKLSGQPHCSTAKNGKILLYTNKKISSKNSTLYYKGKHFSSKYFKIIQL